MGCNVAPSQPAAPGKAPANAVLPKSAPSRLTAAPAGPGTSPPPDFPTRPEPFTSTIAPDSARIENEKIRITFEESAGSITGYPISVFNGTTWFQVGAARPFARFGYRSNRGRDVFADISPQTLQIRQEPDGSSVAELSAQMTDQDGVRWQFQFSFRLAPGNRYVQVSYGASADGPRQLLLFSGPTIYAGEGTFGAAKDVSLLAGLDYIATEETGRTRPGSAPGRPVVGGSPVGRGRRAGRPPAWH